jgi:hypothetical protein
MQQNLVVSQYNLSLSDIRTMAQAFAKSNLFGMKDENQAFALMLVAQAEGRHPATVAQEYEIINGRPAIRSMSALARFQAAGGTIQWITRTDTEAKAEFYHPQGGKVVISWTKARAELAGLWGKNNWKTYPAQMLAARCVAEGVRAVFPACLNGLYLSDEVKDFGGQGPAQQAEYTEVKEPAQQTEGGRPLTPEEIRRDRLYELFDKARKEGMSDDAITDILGTDDWEVITDDQAKLLSDEIRRLRMVKNA